MTDPFAKPLPHGPIDPIDLEEDHVAGRDLVGLLLLGIFNPMGPTLTALSLLRDNQANVSYLLLTSLNPFQQSRQLVASVDDTIGCLKRVIPALGESAPDGLCMSLPNLVLAPQDSNDVNVHLMPAYWSLLAQLELSKPLSDTISEYEAHPGDSWGRIPSFGDMLEAAQSAVRQGIPEPSQQDWETCQAIMSNPQHVVAELTAITQAWSGSIENFGSGQSHMPLEEAAAELTAHGFPFFAG